MNIGPVMRSPDPSAHLLPAPTLSFLKVYAPFVSRFAAMVSLMVCTGASHAADTYPSKPGRLILPFGAGASTDIIGRIFAQRFFDNGVAAAPQTPDEFVKFISVEYAKWKKAVALSGAKVE